MQKKFVIDGFLVRSKHLNGKNEIVTKIEWNVDFLVKISCFLGNGTKIIGKMCKNVTKSGFEQNILRNLNKIFLRWIFCYFCDKRYMYVFIRKKGMKIVRTKKQKTKKWMENCVFFLHCICNEIGTNLRHGMNLRWTTTDR